MRFVTPRLCRVRVISAAFLSPVVLFLGCGGGVNNTGGGSGGAGGDATVMIVTTSTANDQLTAFDMVLKSLTLTSQSGSTASLISVPINAEFLHVNGASEPLFSANVPQGVYTAATASVGYSEFRCVTFISSSDLIEGATYEYQSTPASDVSVNLPSPIAIVGANSALLLNLQVSGSASFGNSCTAGSSSTPFVYSITPTFTLTPIDDANPMQTGLKGFIGAIASSGRSFTVTAIDGTNCVGTPAGGNCTPPAGYAPVWQVATGDDTVFQGITGISQLVLGMAVDMDAALQPDGSLRAKRIAVYDSDPSNLSVVGGPVTFVYGGPSPIYHVFDSVPTEELGPLNVDAYTFSFTDATFQISGQLSNSQTLPFPASFGATNLVAGQNVFVSTNDPTPEGPPIYSPAATITLIPQTINGTISAMDSEGGFTTYTVTLAPYDLFPTLSVQPGQTTLLKNPNTVVVYADSNTQMLNTNPIAVGSVARFYGLVFNDNGALRMDCAQINDGVPE
jgi:hypothetical protein